MKLLALDCKKVNKITCFSNSVNAVFLYFKVSSVISNNGQNIE